MKHSDDFIKSKKNQSTIITNNKKNTMIAVQKLQPLVRMYSINGYNAFPKMVCPPEEKSEFEKYVDVLNKNIIDLGGKTQTGRRGKRLENRKRHKHHPKRSQ